MTLSKSEILDFVHAQEQYIIDEWDDVDTERLMYLIRADDDFLWHGLTPVFNQYIMDQYETCNKRFNPHKRIHDV